LVGGGSVFDIAFRGLGRSRFLADRCVERFGHEPGGPARRHESSVRSERSDRLEHAGTRLVRSFVHRDLMGGHRRERRHVERLDRFWLLDGDDGLALLLGLLRRGTDRFRLLGPEHANGHAAAIGGPVGARSEKVDRLLSLSEVPRQERDLAVPERPRRENVEVAGLGLQRHDLDPDLGLGSKGPAWGVGPRIGLRASQA
jgi:hypothetical protein